MLHVEELELSTEEAEKYGAAIAKVEAQYDVSILSPKQAAWIELATVGASIYGPRYAAYKIRRKREKAQRPTVIDVASRQPNSEQQTDENKQPDIN